MLPTPVQKMFIVAEEDIETMQALLKAGRGVGGVGGDIARISRTVALRGRQDPLIHLANQSADLWCSFCEHSEAMTAFLYGKGGKAMQSLALKEGANLERAAQNLLSGDERKAVMKELARNRQLLMKGEAEIARLAEQLAKEAPLRRIFRNADLALNREALQIADQIEFALRGFFSHLSEVPLSLDIRIVLENYINTVKLKDLNAWALISEKMASFRGLIEKARRLGPDGLGALPGEAFRKLCPGEARNLKGYLYELHWWRSEAMDRMEPVLVISAYKQGLDVFKHADNFELFFIKTPLYDAKIGLEEGKEIYDGLIFIGQPVKNQANVFRGILNTDFELKAVKEPNKMIPAIGRNLRRETESPILTLQTMGNDRQSFMIDSISGEYAPRRIITMPQYPTQRQLTEKLPKGSDTLALVTEMDAAQYDDIAFTLLWAALQGLVKKAP